MRRRTGPLRRYGLALVLLSALVWLFVHETLPAIRERELMRARLRVEQQRLEDAQEAVRLSELWLRGVEEDPLVRERLLDAHARSPGAPGLIEVVTEPAPPPVDDAGTDPAQG